MANGSETENEPQAIRVLTFNILSADQANWKRRREAACTGLQALWPDIVALQETTPGQARNQLTDLLGPEYHVASTGRRRLPARSEQSGCRSLGKRSFRCYG
jgi:endonuclease/exonuclease/phosphatase family metal-dependent hydrolase